MTQPAYALFASSFEEEMRAYERQAQAARAGPLTALLGPKIDQEERDRVARAAITLYRQNLDEGMPPDRAEQAALRALTEIDTVPAAAPKHEAPPPPPEPQPAPTVAEPAPVTTDPDHVHSLPPTVSGMGMGYGVGDVVACRTSTCKAPHRLGVVNDDLAWIEEA